MPDAHRMLCDALKSLPSKPGQNASRPEKKNYSETMSANIAATLGQELRSRGMVGARPSEPGQSGVSGAERRLSGGLGAKKVDVTWATEESGLILGISIKTINFKDSRTRNYQKNLINRRNDMLIEAVSLHRRFPYSTLLGMLFLDAGAQQDQTGRRQSTFDNAFPRLRLFTGRQDPAGRDEQFERLYLALVDATPFGATTKFYEVSDPEMELDLDHILDDMTTLIIERNFDFYGANEDGRILRLS